jgi:hypothetical protein
LFHNFLTILSYRLTEKKLLTKKMGSGASKAPSYTGLDHGIELVFMRSLQDLYFHSFELFFAESLVYLTAFLGFLHAITQKKNSGEYMLFYSIGFIAASVVDPFCLISEQIRNYYHSHASVLLYDRHVAPWQFPLFACIAYVPGAIVWSLDFKSVVAEYFLMIFVSSWTFYCFDLFACRYLLYQWHVSDPLYQAKTECVPLASSMWVCCYASTASILARIAYQVIAKRKMDFPLQKSLTNIGWYGILAICTFLFLPLHIIPITFFYFPSFILNLNLEYFCVQIFGVSSLLLAIGLESHARETSTSDREGDTSSSLAFIQSLVWFCGLFYVIFFLDPSKVISTSVHQPYGGVSKERSSL